MFNISQAVNRNISKLSIGEMKEAIKLVKEVIDNNNFQFDKKLFKDRLNELIEQLKIREERL